MSKKGTFREVTDGLIRGEVLTNKTECGNCGAKTVVIGVRELTLPDGIKPSTRLIPYKPDFDGSVEDTYTTIHFLGIGCGCYARFHRQIAHIQDRKKS